MKTNWVEQAAGRQFSLTVWLERIFGKVHAGRKAEKSRRELLKLGEHLLRDLGFDKEGRPLSPRS